MKQILLCSLEKEELLQAKRTLTDLLPDTNIELCYGLDQFPTCTERYDQFLVADSLHSDKIVAALRKSIPQEKIVSDWRTLPNVPYQRMAIEITGYCNARCKYCPSGHYNREHGSNSTGYAMHITEFRTLVLKLLERRIITTDTLIDLYNWGEPFLNPDLEEIACFLSDNGFSFNLSTNASIPKLLSSQALRGLETILFSMPGFSQESYDRIHGFQFSKICQNIVEMVQHFRKNGYQGNFRIAYHVYQFNLNELPDAIAFAKKWDLDIFPYFAIPAAMEFGCSFLDGSMEYAMLREVGSDLFLFYVEELIAQRPPQYTCPQINLLSIDEYGNLLLGCCVDKYSPQCHEDFILTALKEQSLQEIKQIKQAGFSCATCQHCKEIRADYWGSKGGSFSGQLLEKLLER